MTDVLQLHGVSFVRQGRRILDDINFTVQAGQRWALIGPNGAGKSTMMGLAGALTHPTSGTVSVLGQRLGRVEIRKLRESIGHVNPRHPIESNLTVLDVVLTGLTGTIERMNRWEPTADQITRAKELIDLLGLSQRDQLTWPTMSQGERGRALIARALLPDPALLLLDEPSTGLDVAAREQLLETVDTLHAAHPDIATVLVTHHLEELPESTTHALLMHHGRILAQGAADAVLTTELVSECFEHPIRIERAEGRWSARALRKRV